MRMQTISANVKIVKRQVMKYVHFRFSVTMQCSTMPTAIRTPLAWARRYFRTRRVTLRWHLDNLSCLGFMDSICAPDALSVREHEHCIDTNIFISIISPNAIGLMINVFSKLCLLVLGNVRILLPEHRDTAVEVVYVYENFITKFGQDYLRLDKGQSSTVVSPFSCSQLLT
jgi:hypothetical protein